MRLVQDLSYPLLRSIMSVLTISGKVLGKSQPTFSPWQVSIPEGETTLENLLTQIVRTEVEGFRDRQQQRRLTRILSPTEIELGTAQGKIEAGGSDLTQTVDLQRAIATAIQAFKDGFYLVFIDDQQQEDLADLVRIKPNSELLFLRLVPLVGG
jgi:hypothetical protein